MAIGLHFGAYKSFNDESKRSKFLARSIMLSLSETSLTDLSVDLNIAWLLIPAKILVYPATVNG